MPREDTTAEERMAKGEACPLCGSDDVSLAPMPGLYSLSPPRVFSLTCRRCGAVGTLEREQW